ncbi:MAG: 6-phosphogluconolactonase [Flammeovirgaceae bacterium]|nr:6-phosphogluconolactonase [Flammeovirgaceae bacterium]
MKKNNVTIRVYKSIPELIAALSDYVTATISHAIAVHGECNLVLSGGSSPKNYIKHSHHPIIKK